MEVVAARDFHAGPAPCRIRDALCDSTLWPSVAALVKGFEDRHVPAERGQGADRRQEVVTLGALRDGAQGDVDAPYVAQHRLFDQIPPLRDGLGEAFLGLAPRDAVAAVWAGPGGTATPAHYDPVDNVVGQFCGSSAGGSGGRRAASRPALRTTTSSSRRATRSSCRAAGGTASIPCLVRAAPCPCRCGSLSLESYRRSRTGNVWLFCHKYS